MTVFSALDPLWLRLFRDSTVRGVLSAEFVKSRRAAMGVPEGSNEHGPLYDMGIIDSKSAALLTHISVMLVVLTSIKDQGPPWMQAVLRFELVAYGVLTCVLLRCVDLGGPPFRWPIRGDAQWLLEASLRRTIYQTVLRGVWTLTVLLTAVLAARFLA